MRYGISLLFGVLAIAMLVFPVTGCSDVGSEGGGSGGSGGSAGDGGPGGSGGSAGTGGTGSEMVELSLTATEGEFSTNPGLEGVEFCDRYNPLHCATSDADGEATLDVEVQADGRISYTYGKAGYLSVLRVDVVDDDFTGVYWNWTNTDDVAEMRFDAVMSPYPMEGTGVAAVRAGTPDGNGLAGITFELLDASGLGPYYFTAVGVPSLDLTETTIAGNGGFAEVDPAEVEVRVGGADCVPEYAWPGGAPNTVSIPVDEGFFSWVTVICSDP